MLVDKLGKTLELQNYSANEIVGVQIGTLGHKLWVCIDGVCVLRVKAPIIELEDMRIKTRKDSLENDEDDISIS